MRYDDWRSTEPDFGGRPSPDQEPVRYCDDCHDELGWYSVTVPTGDGGRRYCARGTDMEFVIIGLILWAVGYSCLDSDKRQ